MRKLGDKIGAKLLAEEAGVPVAPWSRGEVASLDAALRAGEEIGYPLMLKATAGGGGRGIRMVASAGDLTDAYERTSQEALRAFGSGVVFLERLITGARHVEVQVIADGQGTAWALGVRDCSVQRRNQKIIEESASPVLSPEQTTELKASAARLAMAVGYRGACTVEFLYHPGEKLFAFLEVNTRLQVEHPITEITTDTDLVRLQLHIAAGGRLEGPQPAESGHAVEARLNAEDPDRDFAPSPGRIAHLVLPAGPGIRVNTGVSEGDTIPADFDSMIAKIIAYGSDRDQALARLRRALGETTVIIEGGVTNKSFVLDLLDQPEVIDASADTGWIDRVRAEGRLVTSRHSAIALAAAAIEAYEDEEEIARQRLLATAHGGRPQVQHETSRPLDLKLRGVGYRVSVARIGHQRFRVGISGGGEVHPADVDIERFDSYSGQITVNGQRYRLVTSTYGPIHLVEVDGVTHRVSLDEGGVVRSPAPALVVATPVSVGDEVDANAPVLVLESMKMETVLRAPFRARVRELPVSVGSQVETGAALLRLEPLADGGDEAGAASPGGIAEIELPAEPAATSAARRAERGMQDLRSLLLGFDVNPHDQRRTLDGYLTARAELGESGRPLAAEVELLQMFADLSELTRNKPAGDDISAERPVHSAREYFHAYLQSLDVERAGLPERFQGRLRRVLGPLRGHRPGAHARPGGGGLPHLPGPAARLDRRRGRLGAAAAVGHRAAARGVAAGGGRPGPGAPRGRHAGALPGGERPRPRRGVPLVRPAAAAPGPRRGLRPGAPEPASPRPEPGRAGPRRADRQAWSPAPSRWCGCSASASAAPGTDPAPLLEVLTRRYYGNKGLSDIRTRDVGGCTFVIAEHVEPARVVTTAVDFAQLADAVRAVGELAADTPAGAYLVADIYLRWADQPEVDAMAGRLSEVITARPLPEQVTGSPPPSPGAARRCTTTTSPSAATRPGQGWPGQGRPAQGWPTQGWPGLGWPGSARTG